MAPTKRSSSDPKERSSASQNSLQRVKGENFYRNAKQVKRLKMLTGGKAVRDRDGKIIQAAAFQKGEDETTPGRVQPDRRWFGTSLSHFPPLTPCAVFEEFAHTLRVSLSCSFFVGR
jgi:nuclear GTP-binding protein